MMEDLIMKTHDSKEALKELDKLRNTRVQFKNKNLNNTVVTFNDSVLSPDISFNTVSKDSSRVINSY